MSTVVITGGSRGIGAAAVELFAARGDRVYFLYEKNHAAARAVEQRTGAKGLCCDVASREQVEAAFARIPRVDVLICCAGICHYGLMRDMPEEAWDRLFAVNVKGVYHCVNASMPSFLREHRGCVITVSSTSDTADASDIAQSQNLGVYILYGQVVRFRKIDVIYFGDDYAIVSRNTESSDSLKLYDMIITKGRNLYDGKIIG